MCDTMLKTSTFFITEIINSLNSPKIVHFENKVQVLPRLKFLKEKWF